MATIVPAQGRRVNPLKSSQPLGAAFAYLGVAGAVPLFHGSQGCTSFALVLFVRHFKETIPLQTTAMDEVATILGGADHLEEAILNLKTRAKPALIGIATTALVETRGEDFVGDLAAIKAAAPPNSTEPSRARADPRFRGAIEEGWTKAVVAMIETIARREVRARRNARRVNILPGSHLTVADVEHFRAHGRGLRPGAGDLPRHFRRARRDRAGELDSDDLRRHDDRRHPLARRSAPDDRHRRADARAGRADRGADRRRIRAVPAAPRPQGGRPPGRAADELSGRPAPASVRRRRAQLQDALLDGHFHFSGKKIAIAAEPDLLYGLATFFVGMGAEIHAAVTTTGHSKILEHVPCDSVKVGDLGDFEAMAEGADLLVTHSHGRQASERLGVPLMRVGFPIFDRLGSQHKLRVGYQGARDLIFEVANIFEGARHEPTPESLNPFLNRENNHGRGAASANRQH